MEVHVASDVEIKSAGISDHAVIVDSQGGRFGVIGWGADCFCLRTKTSDTNGTQTSMSLKMLTTVLISISITNEGEHLIYEDVRHPDEICLPGELRLRH